MKSRISLIVSIALNLLLALAALMLVRAHIASPHDSGAGGKSTEEKAVPPGVADDVRSIRVERSNDCRHDNIAGASSRRRFIIDQLRAMGVPNDILALVARTDYESEWDLRFDACKGDPDQLAKVQLEMKLAKDAALTDALGAEAFKEWDQKYMLWEAMSTEVDASPEEGAAIYQLKKKLQQAQLQMEQARVNGTMDEAGIARANDLAYAEFNRQLRAVLGEERYACSQQQDDAFAALLLRHQYAAAKPTEEQFQELFKAERAWNAALGKLDRTSADYLTSLKALNAGRDREYERILGEKALQALRKAEDPGVITMKKFQSLWGLNNDAVDFVYDAMSNYQRKADEMRAATNRLVSSGQQVDWASVSGGLERLAQETHQLLQKTVGDAALTKLQRNGVVKFARVQSRPNPK